MRQKVGVSKSERLREIIYTLESLIGRRQGQLHFETLQLINKYAFSTFAFIEKQNP